MTSMTISILGIIMIVATVAVFAYIGISGISSKVTSNVDSGSAYDQLASMQSEYSSLNSSFMAVKSKASASSNSKIRNDTVDAELQLVRAQSSITDVQSALSTNQPQDVVNARLKAAIAQLQQTETSVNKVTGEV